MPSIDAIRGSDGSENANLATIQSTRSAGASTIVADTVTGWPTNFHASMGTPHTFVDPVTSETITVISEASAVDFKGHIDGGNIEIDDIAPGYVDNGSAVGDIVILKPTTQWADNVADTLAVEHNDNGTHGDVTATSLEVSGTSEFTGAVTLPANTIDTPEINDGAVTGEKLDPNSMQLVQGTFTTDYTSTSMGDLGTIGSATIPTWATTALVMVFVNGIRPVTNTNDMSLRIKIGTATGITIQAYSTGNAVGEYVNPSWADTITLSGTGSQSVVLQAQRTGGSNGVRTDSTSDFTVMLFYR